jgi:hypothetical protein
LDTSSEHLLKQRSPASLLSLKLCSTNGFGYVIQQQKDEKKFYLPISEMGDYMPVIRKAQLLRDPLSEDEVNKTPNLY